MRLGRCSRRVLRAFCVLAEPVCRVYFLCPVGVPCVRRVGKSLQLYRSAHRPEHCRAGRYRRSHHTAASPPGRDWRVDLRTPLLWLAGCSVLVVHGPGVQLFLPGVDALQAQALAAVLMEETP